MGVSVGEGSPYILGVGGTGTGVYLQVEGVCFDGVVCGTSAHLFV